MSPQLTLQTPLQLPPGEIPSYLEQLWSNDQPKNAGANTFCLLVWQPAWIEQELVRIGKIKGPIVGTQNQELIKASQEVVLEENLPISTPPFDSTVISSLSNRNDAQPIEDQRGQHIDAAISALQPRRLITLAPTIKTHNLEALVAAYCPLPEEGSGNSACGDVVVLRGDVNSLHTGLDILTDLLPEDLPSWLWWNGSLDERPEILNQLSSATQRLIIDSAIGDPIHCLDLLQEKIKEGQAINDLNWLRLRNWRESLAMVFDPPTRRDSLEKVVKLDIDIQGKNPVQGLLLAAWLADRLGWQIKSSNSGDLGNIDAIFHRSDGGSVNFSLVPLPVGKPSIHPGEVIGIRMICKPDKSPQKATCVILGAESGECMRLEAGGMASMELVEEVVPTQIDSVEKDVARLLASSRGTTSPLLAAAAPVAAKLLNSAKTSNRKSS